MENNRLNRRQALAGLGLAGATGMLPLAAAAIAQAQSADRAAWDRAFRTYEKAKAEYQREDARHTPIWEAYRAAVAAVPHVTLRPDPYSGRREPLTTDDRWTVRDARRMVRELAEGRRRHDPYPDLMAHEKLYRELAAAADARDAEIERIDRQLGYTPSAEACERACNAMVEAEHALHEIASPDGPALLWKLESTWLDDEEASYCKERVSLILSDARRLLSSGRA